MRWRSRVPRARGLAVAAEAQLKLAALVYDNSAEAMIVLDSSGIVIGINHAFVELTGWSRGTVVGRHIGEIPGPANGPATMEAIRRELASKGRWAGEVWTFKASGERFLARASVSAIRDEPAGLRRSVVMFSDITEQKKTEEALWRHANVDPLTSLPNRRNFLERLDAGIARARESDEWLGLVFIDLDRFKDINDSLGHEMGDLLLKEAAARVHGAMRKDDLVARLGGDEFTVMVPNLTDVEPLERAAERIVEALAAPFQLGAETCFVSASVGVTLFPRDARDADGLLRGADMAMYEAKRDGRNRYKFFTAGLQAAMAERAELVRDLHKAIECRQFELQYQPIVDLATGDVDKAEALIRWRHPTRGLVLPSDFIPLAEETGLIVAIGEWVFDEAARQLAAWRSEFAQPLCVSVNASPVQFSAAVRRLRALPDILAQHGLEGSAMILEVTESVLLEATDETRSLIAELCAHGLRLALDDFGTGYSSLAYLRQLEIAFLKIDKVFVRGLVEGGGDLAICEAVIAMARRLGIAVVAEGVETEVQRQLLADALCPFGQGYLFARPMPAAEFEQVYLRPAQAPVCENAAAA